jgi:hypothetical protein
MSMQEFESTSKNDDVSEEDAPAPYIPRDKLFYATARCRLAAALLPNGYSGGTFDPAAAASTAETVARFLDGGIAPSNFVLPRHQLTLTEIASVEGNDRDGHINMRDLQNRQKAIKDKYGKKGIPKKEAVEKEAKAALAKLQDVSEIVRTTALETTVVRIAATGRLVVGGNPTDALAIAAEEVENVMNVMASLDIQSKSFETVSKAHPGGVPPEVALGALPYPTNYAAEVVIALMRPDIVDADQRLTKMEGVLAQLENEPANGVAAAPDADASDAAKDETK